MNWSVVIMGVAGCGKSSLGAIVADAKSLPFIEGDDFHSATNRSKMSKGIPLNDEDRDGWLSVLSEQLQIAPNGIVLSCSSLKRKYRDRLRMASPGLRFVFLDLTREIALLRVSARASHFLPASLIESQFSTLESPVDELDVLTLDATESLDQLQYRVSVWLQK
jgi:gluconokinase